MRSGGPALMIRTVEGFMGHGIKVSHLIEVDFENFPALIDSLGGIDVTVKQKICSPPFDNFWKGLTFRRGERHLNGERALGFARIRKNSCAPNETDIDRARRQQEVLSAIKGSVTSPGTFFRLPAGELARAAGHPHGHEGPLADGAVRRPGHRQQRRDDGARALLPLVRPGRQPRGVGRGEAGRRAEARDG